MAAAPKILAKNLDVGHSIVRQVHLNELTEASSSCIHLLKSKTAISTTVMKLLITYMLSGKIRTDNALYPKFFHLSSGNF